MSAFAVLGAGQPVLGRRSAVEASQPVSLPLRHSLGSHSSEVGANSEGRKLRQLCKRDTSSAFPGRITTMKTQIYGGPSVFQAMGDILDRHYLIYSVFTLTSLKLKLTHRAQLPMADKEMGWGR